MSVRHPEIPADDLTDYYGDSHGRWDLSASPVLESEPSYQLDGEWFAPGLEPHELPPLDEPGVPGSDDFLEDGYQEPYAVAYARWILDEIDWVLTVFMANHAIRMLQLGIGAVYFWFGAVKLVPGLSPAEDLVLRTVGEFSALVGIGIPARLALVMLAWCEVAIGLGFLADRYRRAVVWATFVHLLSAATPLVLLPGLIWTAFPHGLTLEGQYIVKNLVILAAAATVGATVRGGYLAAAGPQVEPVPDSTGGEWGGPANVYATEPAVGATAAGSDWFGPADSADSFGSSPPVPKVWVVNEDGSLMATYELDNYVRDVPVIESAPLRSR